MRHDWPGNVRELRNAVAVAHALIGDDEEMDIAAHLGALSESTPSTGMAGAPLASFKGRQFQDAKRDVLARFERDYFAVLSEEAKGNVSEMARRAGMERAHVRAYLRRHGIGAKTGRRRLTTFPMDAARGNGALDRAAVLHERQFRKYPGVSVPYVSHVAGVVAILARHGFDEHVQAAGALHDVIEDCGVSHADLEAAFGVRVATLVEQCSLEADRTLAWEERKRRYIEALRRQASLGTPKRSRSPNRIDNFESILVCAADVGDPWPMFKRGKREQIARFDALAEKFAVLAPHLLLDEYRARLEMLRAVPDGLSR